MIKIRYQELPEGLHARVEPRGRQTVIYLLPGLSPSLRKAALRRLIRTSRRGHGPRLQAPAVVLAMGWDITKSTVHNGVAAVRVHPAASLCLTGMITSLVVCYAMFVSVTIRLTPRAPRAPRAPPAPPVAASSGQPAPGLAQHLHSQPPSGGGTVPGQPIGVPGRGRGSAQHPGGTAPARPGASPAPLASVPGGPVPADPGGLLATAGSTGLPPGLGASPAPLASLAPPSPGLAVSSATPAASPSPSRPGVCILIICVSV